MSKLTIVKESKEEFVIEGAEYEALHSIIYDAYDGLCADLDDGDLSFISRVALSRELDAFNKLKRIFQKEIS